MIKQQRHTQKELSSILNISKKDIGKDSIKQENFTVAGSSNSIQNIKIKKGKNIKYRHPANFYQNCGKVERPLSFRYIFNVFNLFLINQRAMKQPQMEQGYISTIFTEKIINKVQVRTNELVLHVKNSNFCPQVQLYLVERMKSYGDTYFFQVGCLLQKIINFMNLLPPQNKSVQNEKQIRNNLMNLMKRMKGKMYMSDPGKVIVISKPLLDALGYDMNQLALQCVRNKALVRELFTNISYPKNVKKILQFIINKMQGQQSENLENTFSCPQYLLTKKGESLLCKCQADMMAPYYEVKEIMCKKDSLEGLDTNMIERRRRISTYSDKLFEKEAECAKKLMYVPKNMLNSNISLMASTKEIASMKIENEIQ